MIRPPVVTVHSPEHVAIELVPAGFGRRFAAFLLDILLIVGLTSLVALAGKLIPGGLDQLVVTTIGFLLMWGWHVWFETRSAGRSPGKMAFGLRVVDGRGLPIDLRQSLVRNVVRALDLLPVGGFGMACCLLHPHRRRLGDIAADTLVVEERQAPGEAHVALQARRANSLDTPRIRRLVRLRLSLEEREFLLACCLRAPALEEKARYDLFERVADRYRQRLELRGSEHLSGENLVRGLLAVGVGQ